MAKKNTTIVSEMASPFGAAAARVENLKPKRAATAKHSKAKTVTTTTQEQAVSRMSEQDEIALQAYLYSESRGFLGGSPEADWLRAEQAVRSRRSSL